MNVFLIDIALLHNVSYVDPVVADSHMTKINPSLHASQGRSR